MNKTATTTPPTTTTVAAATTKKSNPFPPFHQKHIQHINFILVVDEEKPEQNKNYYNNMQCSRIHKRWTDGHIPQEKEEAEFTLLHDIS